MLKSVGPSPAEQPPRHVVVPVGAALPALLTAREREFAAARLTDTGGDRM